MPCDAMSAATMIDIPALQDVARRAYARSYNSAAKMIARDGMISR